MKLTNLIKDDNVTGSGEMYNEPLSYEDKLEELENKLLSELSYGDYKNDNSRSSRNKINSNIKEINSKLREVEQMINHASKLKLESGSDQGVFWKGTMNSFLTIRERLNRLNQKIVEMTA